MVAECFVYCNMEDKLLNLLEISKVKMLELVTWINVIFKWIINAVKLRVALFENV